MRSSANRRRRSAAAGFTLLEMLVVVAVLAVAFAVLGGLGSAPGGGRDLRFAAAEIAGALRVARSQAMVENRRAAVAFDLRAGAWQMDRGSWNSLPENVRVTLLTTRGEVVGDALARIGFRPDGSSSGGRITLKGQGRAVTIGVDWLSGRVSLAETP